MTYYSSHLFFCTNQKAEGKKCCNNFAATEMVAYAKSKIKRLGLSGEGKIRVSSAGCLGRCEVGPAIVIYPEAVWYTYQNQQDVDEIIERHMLKGERVERLLLPAK